MRASTSIISASPIAFTFVAGPKVPVKPTRIARCPRQMSIAIRIGTRCKLSVAQYPSQKKNKKNGRKKRDLGRLRKLPICFLPANVFRSCTSNSFVSSVLSHFLIKRPKPKLDTERFCYTALVFYATLLFFCF